MSLPVPEKQIFLDLIAHLHSVTVRDAPLNCTIEWNNFWEGIGLIGVQTKNRGLLQQLRTLIATATNGKLEFCTVPKTIFESGRDFLSLMLHDDNRGLELSDIATMLHRKNKLAGELKVVQSKSFSARDKTRTGRLETTTAARER